MVAVDAFRSSFNLRERKSTDLFHAGGVISLYIRVSKRFCFLPFLAEEIIVTFSPAALSICAAASPAMPAPIISTSWFSAMKEFYHREHREHGGRNLCSVLSVCSVVKNYYFSGAMPEVRYSISCSTVR